MSVRQSEIPSGIRDLLRQSLDRLGVTQLGLAKSAGVSQGFVSNLLTGKRPVGDRGLVKAIADALQERLTAMARTGMMERVDAAEIQQVLNALRVHFGLVKRERRSLPGGAVASDAVNYLDRSVDHDGWQMASSESIAEILQELPLAMIVSGPVHSGKTTYMKALEREFVNAGVRVASLDAKLASNLEEARADGEATRNVIRQLSRLIKTAWGLPGTIPPDENLVVAFASWLEEQLRAVPAEERLIAIDNLTDLPDGAGFGVLRVLRNLHNARAANTDLPSICVAIGLNSPRAKDMLESSMTAFNVHVALDWFDASDVETLASRLEPERLPKFVDRVFDYFRGQPYATDVGLRLLIRGADWAQVQERASDGTGAFAQHEHNLRRTLQDGRSGLALVTHRSDATSVRRPDIQCLLDAYIIGNLDGTFNYASEYYGAVVPRLVAEIESVDAEGGS